MSKAINFIPGKAKKPFPGVPSDIYDFLDIKDPKTHEENEQKIESEIEKSIVALLKKHHYMTAYQISICFWRMSDTKGKRFKNQLRNHKHFLHRMVMRGRICAHRLVVNKNIPPQIIYGHLDSKPTNPHNILKTLVINLFYSKLPYKGQATMSVAESGRWAGELKYKGKEFYLMVIRDYEGEIDWALRELQWVQDEAILLFCHNRASMIRMAAELAPRNLNIRYTTDYDILNYPLDICFYGNDLKDGLYPVEASLFSFSVTEKP